MLSLQKWARDGQYFEYKSQHKVFSKKTENGEPLVLIHGFPTASWDWWKIWDSLNEKYSLYTLDMMGFGLTDKPTSYMYSLMDQADLFEQYMKSEGLDEIHILAHDYGDTVAQELMHRANNSDFKHHPFKLKSVCFLNGGLFAGVHKPLLIQKILMSPIGFLISPLLSQSRLEKSFNRIFGPNTKASQEEMDTFWHLIYNNNGKKVAHKLIHYMAEREVHSQRWLSAIQDAKYPVRLIDGLVDPISGGHVLKKFEELIPNADVVGLENIGHYPQTEAPDQLLHHYFEFRNAIS